MKHSYLLPMLLVSTSVILSGCTGRHERVDLSGIHTSAARETMAASTVAATAATTAPEPDESSPSGGSSLNVSARVETYKDSEKGDISIQYPVVLNLSDTGIQKQVNELLLANATAVADTFSSQEPVTLDITCKVVSVDRNRLTAVYKGTCQVQGGPYPTNLFYTNTVDLKQAKSLGFNDYSDAYTMAGYVMSDDVQFYQAGSDMTQALLSHRASMSVEQYTQIFEQADFPLTADGDGAFPQSFSYTHEGVLYFSIPVPHALGDYAIVTFNMDGK
ncbi:MAG: hypothetical protein HFG73_03945 [Hungatella sp.]|nr:hypothetical protein [Hungatella sp.]